jgi:inner membrane protein
MPTIVSHAAVPLAFGLGLGREAVSRRLLMAAVAASIVPDLDVIGYRLGVPYGSAFGHRGFTHSLAFAMVLGLVALLSSRWLMTSRMKAFVLVVASAASHGLLDMCTNGGRGVALFWPFTDERYFFPWRPIEVSPLSLARVLSERGAQVFASELVWVWAPAAVLCALIAIGRRMQRP